MVWFKRSVAISITKKTFSYKITEEGIKNTDTYTALRQNVLIDLVKKKQHLNLDKLSNVLSELITIYEEADRTVLSYMEMSKPIIEK